MSIPFLLTILSGLLWTVVYIDSIRIGLKDKTYAMPLWALGLNIAWECLHFFLGYQAKGWDTQVIVNGVWFLFDIGLLYTYFRYGRKYFPKNLNDQWFVVWAVLVIAVSFLVQYGFILQFGLAAAAAYAAYLQNLLMSVLFIAMLVQRASSEGQSMLIAWCKFLGSLAPTITISLLAIQEGPQKYTLLLIVGALMALFDVIYIWMLARVKAGERAATRPALLV